MQTDEHLNDDERDIARNLARLRPAAVGGTPEAIRLRAQLRRWQRRTWTWRAVAAGLLVATAVVATVRPERVERQVVYVDRPTPSVVATPSIVATPAPVASASTAVAVASGEYLLVRDRVLREGWTGLPSSGGGGGGAGEQAMSVGGWRGRTTGAWQ